MIFMDNKKTSKEPIFIWGAGGHGRCLADVFAGSSEFEAVCFVDDNPELEGKSVDGLEVISGKDAVAELKRRNVKRGIVGIGDIVKRCEIFEMLEKEGFSFANAIDSTAVITRSCKIGRGVAIMPGAVISSRAKIADNVIINEGAVIGHDNVIGFGSHIAGGVSMMGEVKVGEKTLIGVGASIICRNVGSNSIIGAGSVATEDITDGVIAVGSPARAVRKKE